MRERLRRRPTWDGATPVKQQIADLLDETQTLELQITQLSDDTPAASPSSTTPI